MHRSRVPDDRRIISVKSTNPQQSGGLGRGVGATGYRLAPGTQRTSAAPRSFSWRASTNR